MPSVNISTQVPWPMVIGRGHVAICRPGGESCRVVSLAHVLCHHPCSPLLLDEKRAELGRTVQETVRCQPIETEGAINPRTATTGIRRWEQISSWTCRSLPL